MLYPKMYFDLTKWNLSFIGKTRHHQDFHLNDAWFMFSNPVRQMPYISNFRGLLFYGHLSNPARFFYLSEETFVPFFLPSHAE